MTGQQIAQFQSDLTAQGFEVTTKSMDSSCDPSPHTHDFDVRALVTDGAINITVDGETKRFGAGDQFTMAAGCVHGEAVGPEGATFVVGRRDPARR